MGKIVLLDDLTINQIAAGEVIERPASVVKELVENSIDAGAKNITIEIKNGGISYIRISDDGSGILPDDMEIAFERHATSKIRSADDLDNIKSMGFRGEALASIASIARVEMVSKVEDQENGYRLVVKGGNILEKEETGCSKGTSITIEELFYNTPVRYKFLKKDFTEIGYIEETIKRIALANPSISIKLLDGNKITIQTSGNDNLNDTIYSIYGKEVATNIIPVDYTYEDIRITGVIGKPLLSRSNRVNQLFYINHRFIKDKTLSSAAERGFQGTVMVGKHGFLILNIDLDPKNVDVNVHPTKLEVRFQDESKLFKAVYHAIKETLLKGDLISNPYKDGNPENDEFNSLRNNITNKQRVNAWQINKEEITNSTNEKEIKSPNFKEFKNTITNLDDKTRTSFMNDIAKAKTTEELIEGLNKYKDLKQSTLKELGQDTFKKETETENNEKISYKEEISKSFDVEELNEISKNDNTENILEKENTEEKKDKIEEEEDSKSFEVKDNEKKSIKEKNSNELSENANENQNDIKIEEKKDIVEDDKDILLGDILNSTDEKFGDEYERIKNKLGGIISGDNSKENELDKADYDNNDITIKINGEVIPKGEEYKNNTVDLAKEKDQNYNIESNKNNDQKENTNEEEKMSFEQMYQKLFGRNINEAKEEYKEKQAKEEEELAIHQLDGDEITLFEDEEKNNKNKYIFVGIAFKTYIILTMNDDMYLLDQHAAHERIMFEKVKENYYKEENKDSQLMLLPDIIHLNNKEMGIYLDNKQRFIKAGFMVEDFGDNVVKLTGVPEFCLKFNTEEFFLETLDEIDTVARTAKQEVENKFLSTIACKAAVKAHMALTKEEVEKLMDQLLQLPNPFTCPHGRPTIIKMSKSDIEKKFARRL